MTSTLELNNIYTDGYFNGFQDSERYNLVAPAPSIPDIIIPLNFITAFIFGYGAIRLGVDLINYLKRCG